jgi:uncharacterized protein (TIGR03382 family)
VVVLIALIAPLSRPGSAHAWGRDGHEAIVRLAAGRVQETCLRGFLSARLSTLLIHCLDPDRWKEDDPDEPPRHYLDVDAAGDPAGYPREFDAVVSRFGQAQALAQGTVPWRTAQFASFLAERFAGGDVEETAIVAGQLAHYVGDGHCPLHATVNYDGQLTGDPGLHERWETRMVRWHRSDIEVQAAAIALPLPADPEPVGTMFQAILSGNALVPAIVAADLEAGGQDEGLYRATGGLAARRWAEAATLLAALWTEAWKRAGQPQLPETPPECAAPSSGPDGNPGPPPQPQSPTGIVMGGGGCAAAGAPGALGWLVVLAFVFYRRRRPRA